MQAEISGTMTDEAATVTSIQNRIRHYIVSASGIRAVYAADGDENSATTEISAADRIIAGLFALSFLRFMQKRTGKPGPVIATGSDSRPTGAAICDAVLRVLVSRGAFIRHCGVLPSPQIMAFAGKSKDIDGFLYVTASHNPVGHNGFKAGAEGGGVIGGKDSEELNALFLSMSQDQNAIREVADLQAAGNGNLLRETLFETETWKASADRKYLCFALQTATGYSDQAAQDAMLSRVMDGCRKSPLGILADFNGSARCASIDETFLSRFGVGFKAMNAIPGVITHAIIPEGDSLVPCRKKLEKLYKEDPSFTIGYVPDNDGDRGNLVYIDPETGKVLGIEAQEIFALSCIAELACLVYNGILTYDESGKAEQKVAVVVNCPTSLRIERIAECFDVRVFRCEVGEANVVGLARDVRSSGFIVPVFGEGSNGGTIVFPAAVRDPLNTIGGLLKILLLGGNGKKPDPFRIWCERSGQQDKWKETRGIADLLATIPRFTTTGVTEERAVFPVNTTNQRAFKNAYEQVFLEQWDARKAALRERFHFYTWEEINYEGKEEKHGFGDEYRSGKAKGGFKILFKNEKGKKVGFIWMRSSGTEPVFRVLADLQGSDAEGEAELLAWHRQMIAEADALTR
jgi:phosphoglucomutase